METVSFGIRLGEEIAERVRSCATKNSRPAGQVVSLCVEEFLPVLESGVFGTPIWDRIRQRWAEDLEEAKRNMATVAGGVRSSHGTAARKTRMAA